MAHVCEPLELGVNFRIRIVFIVQVCKEAHTRNLTASLSSTRYESDLYSTVGVEQSDRSAVREGDGVGPSLQTSIPSARGQQVKKTVFRVRGLCDGFPCPFPGSSGVEVLDGVQGGTGDLFCCPYGHLKGKLESGVLNQSDDDC